MKVTQDEIREAFNTLQTNKAHRVGAEIQLQTFQFTAQLAKAAFVVAGIEGKNAEERNAKLALQFEASNNMELGLEKAVKLAKLNEEVASLTVDRIKTELRLLETMKNLEVTEQLRELYAILKETPADAEN